MLQTQSRISLSGKHPLFVFVYLFILLVSVPASATDLSFSTGAVPWSGDTPVAVSAADFNGGGTKDLAVLTSSSVTLLSGIGNGTFADVGTYFTGLFNQTAFAAGDFNHDGRPDLAIVEQFSGEITILTNDGSGSFSSDTYSSPDTNISGIAAGDFNGDGWDDLALLGSDGSSISLHINDHSNSFSVSPGSTATTANSIKTADYNHNGHSDLLVINTFGKSVSILLGQSNGSFASGPSASLATFPQSAALADFDSDGFSDLAICGINPTFGISTY